MSEKNEVKILAVVGMSGSGKSVVVDFLTKKGIPKVYFGGMIYKEMERRGIQRTADGSSERQFREMIRETEGKDWVVRQVMGEIDNLIASGQKRIVLGKREERPFTLKEIQERDYTEVENIEKGGPIAMADYYILNDGSVAEMNEKMAEILTRMEF